MKLPTYLRQDLAAPTLGTWLYSLLLILLPNVVFLVFTHYAGVSRPLLNIDYLLALLFLTIPWRPIRLLGGVCLVLALISDVLMLVIQLFPFMDLAAIRYLARFIPIAPLNYIVISLFFFCCTVVLLGLIFFFSRPKYLKPPYPTFITACLLITSYVVMQTGLTYTSFTAILGRDNFYYAHSQSLLYKQLISDDFYSLMATTPQLTTLASNKERIADQLIQPTSPRILYVVAESWGQLTNAQAQQAILQHIFQQKERLDHLSTGYSKAYSATVAGELRELCGLQLKQGGFALGNLAAEQFDNCLPNQLKQRGYQTISVHGTNGLLYDRTRWYAKAGFQRTLFGEHFLGLKRCAAFKGVCDSELMTQVGDIFKQHQNNKLFLYWMTLTSHQPYAKKDIYNKRFDCERFNIQSDSDVCHNAQLQTQFFDELAKLIQRPEMQGVEVIVVGDHPPPLWGEEDLVHIIPWKVSWLHFRVK